MSLKTPELSLDLINDALEYHSHVIVNGTMEDEGALEDHWDSLRYFWKISDDHQPSCGRIFHRCRLAELVFYACNRHPYGELDEETPKHVAAKEEEIHAMVNWEPKDWASLKRKLVRVCHSIKREDANRTVRSQHDERPEEVPERANDQNFSGKHIAYLVRHITINKHLSHIRLQMEEWRRSNSRKQPHIDEADLMEFQNDLMKLKETDKKKYEFLKQFLATDSTPTRPKLAPMDDLDSILQQKPCNLELLQADLLGIVVAWNKALFQEKEPALFRLGYGDLERETIHTVYESGEGSSSEEEEEEEEVRHSRRRSRNNNDNDRDMDDRKPAARASPDEVHDMRHARASLKQSAPDPLQEAVETAEQVAAPTRQAKNDDSGFPVEDDSTAPEDGRPAIPPHHTPQRTNRSSQKGGTPAAAAAASGSASRKRRPDKQSSSKKRSRDNVLDDDQSEITEPTSPKRSRSRHDTSTSKSKRKKRSREEEASEQSSPKRRRHHKDKSPRKKSSSSSRGEKIRFNDSDEDDELKSVKLTDFVPSNSGSPFQRRSPGGNHNKNVHNSKPLGTGTRKVWSTEEKIAIKEGLRIHGKGKWVLIQKEFPEVLANRTNVQIKDCARTMEKNGELD